jgi:hypothetical protein
LVVGVNFAFVFLFYFPDFGLANEASHSRTIIAIVPNKGAKREGCSRAVLVPEMSAHGSTPKPKKMSPK